MSIYFADPAPTLVINVKTKEMVITKNITGILERDGGGAYIHVVGSPDCFESNDSPQILRARLFDLAMD